MGSVSVEVMLTLAALSSVKVVLTVVLGTAGPVPNGTAVLLSQLVVDMFPIPCVEPLENMGCPVISKFPHCRR